MRKVTILKGVALTFIVFIALSCNNPRTHTTSKPVMMNRQVTTIDANSPVTVDFLTTPELFKKLSEEDKKEVVELVPHVAGKAFLVNSKQIVFQPEKILKYGAKYKVVVHLDKLFTHPDVGQYAFTIKVVPLQIDLFFDNFVVTAHNSDSYLQLTGHLLCSGKIAVDVLKNHLTATLGNKSMPVVVKQGEDYSSFHFSIDSIKQTTEDQMLTVVLDKNIPGIDKQESYQYTIPAAGLFSLINFDVKEEPETHVALTFSDVPDNNQNLDGLVYFADGTPVKLFVKNNRLLVYPQKKLTGTHKLIISREIKNSKNKTLNKQYTLKTVFKLAPPEIKFIGKGNILPGKKGWLIPFEAINLTAVDVVVFKIYSNNIKQFLQQNNLGDRGWQINYVGEYIHHEKIQLEKAGGKPLNKWNSYAIDLSKMIKSEPGAIYRIGFRFKMSYAQTECVKKTSETEQYDDSTSYFYGNYYRPGGFSWSRKNNPCDPSYYNSDHFPERNFLASNIGLTVKNSNPDEYTVYARDLLTDEPLDDVILKFYSYQNQLIGEGNTDKSGEVVTTLKKEPFMVVANLDNQFAYLKLRKGMALSYSKFDVSGGRLKKGLKGYLFGERGVWRPGDTLHLTFVLQDKEKILPAGHPVLMEVRDVRGWKVYSKTSTDGINGFYVFNVPVSADAPTGIWRATVKIGNNTFSKSLRIETILPNRLKINMTTDNDRFLAGRKGMLYLKAEWLHGGVASDLKASVTESIAKSKTSFKSHPDFIFDDPAYNFYPDEQSVFEGKLNSKGNAETEVILPDNNNLPGTLKLTFVAKVFEPGGRFSIDQKSFKYSAYTRYVGIKPPEKGGAYSYETNKKQKFEVITVDDEGNPVSVNNLKVEVFRLDWSWWYNSQNSNLAGYINQHYFDRIVNKTINTVNGKGTFTFKIIYPDWGNYYVRVSDKDGGHSAGMIMYIDWPNSYSRKNRKAPGDATLLSLTTDKKSYQVGEKATVSFRGAANAKALVTLEKNNKTLKSWWVETTAGESAINFEITKEMAPNVYAFVSVIQPHNQTANDLPIRSYGVIPVMVNDSETILTPMLSVPDKIKPNSTYDVTVSELNKRKMTYVLAVVDEGLLDLTHFKTPSLHDYFYKKEALAVRTWDVYDEVNGAFGGRLSQVFAIGGDEEMRELGKKKVNRFKPVVTFLGPFILEKNNGKKTHHLFMPNYTGAVRIMVIAGYNGAYGSIEKTVPVKQPLMVLASFPRTLVPGETLRLPVTVFAMDDSIKTVLLKVKTNKLFKVKHDEQTITFAGQGDKVAYVDLKVNDKEGVGEADLTVSSGDKEAHYSVKINIRNPNQRLYKTETYTVEKNKTWTGTPMFANNAGDYRFNATVSVLPSINLEQRIKYLIHYPYGCIEQTVSAAMPQLILSKLTSLSEEEKSRIEDNVQRAIARLNYFQLSSGGFSYWPGKKQISLWGTTYAGHFMLLAKEAGYYVPAELFNKWTENEQNMSNRWRIDSKKGYHFDFEQAYRLYTLALAGKPNISAMNRMRNINGLSREPLLRLAAAYAVINEKNSAAELIDVAAKGDVGNKNYRWYSYGSETRNKALAMETYLLMGDKAKAFPLFKEIANELGSEKWMSTQTTAFALYAVSLFANNQPDNNFSFNYRFNDKKESVESNKPVFSFDLPAEQNKKLTVTNKSDQTLFVNLVTSAIPKPGEVVNKSDNLMLTATYFDMNGNSINPEVLKQGKDFYVKIEVRSTSFLNCNNLALSAIFPSGWEILNTRMVDVGSGLHSSYSNYTDIRDDRVNLFFNLNNKGDAKVFYILLNAAYPGRYYRSPITCKAMYNNSINAATGGGMTEVEE